MKHLLIIVLLFVSFSAFAKEKTSKKALEAPQPPLSLTDKGLGPIGTKVNFNKKKVAALFPGYKVTEFPDEGESPASINVSKDGKAWFSIYSKAASKEIFSILVKNKKIKSKFSFAIGDSYKKTFANKKAKCSAGMESFSGTVICQDLVSKKVSYIFEGSWNGPDGKLPPKKALATWKISSIVWRK